MSPPKNCLTLSDFARPEYGVRRDDGPAAGTAAGLVKINGGGVYLISAAHVIAWAPKVAGAWGDRLLMPALAKMHGKAEDSVIATLSQSAPRDPGPGKSKTGPADAACAKVEPEWIQPLEQLFNGYLKAADRPAPGNAIILMGGCNGKRKGKIISPVKPLLNMTLPRNAGGRGRHLILKDMLFSSPGLGGPGDSGGGVFDAAGGWVGVYNGRNPATGTERGGVISPAGAVLRQLGFPYR
jgi:hypothetical protein